MLLASVGIFLLTLPLAPIQAKVSPSIEAEIFWGLVAISAAFGLASSQGAWRSDAATGPAEPVDIRPLIHWILLFGTIGTLLLVVDRYFVRGVPIGLDIFASRKALEDSEAGLLSTLAAALAAFSLFVPGLIRVSEALGGPLRSRVKVLAWISALIYILASVLLGSRSVFAVFFIMTMLTRAYARELEGSHAKGRSKYWVYLAAVLVLIAFSVAMMLNRLQQMGLDPMLSIRISAYAATVNISPWLMDFTAAHPAISPVVATVLSLVLYCYHGLFEFFLMFDSYRAPHTMGALIGWLPFKVISVFTGQNFAVDKDSLEGVRSGIYTSFTGPAFIDFGWFAVPMVGLIFWGMGLPTRLLKAGRVLWLPWVLMVSVTCVFFPILNLLESATGAYPLVAACCIPLLGRFLRIYTPSVLKEFG